MRNVFSATHVAHAVRYIVNSSFNADELIQTTEKKERYVYVYSSYAEL